MKKRIMVVLEVESDDEINIGYKFIEQTGRARCSIVVRDANPCPL